MREGLKFLVRTAVPRVSLRSRAAGWPEAGSRIAIQLGFLKGLTVAEWFEELGVWLFSCPLEWPTKLTLRDPRPSPLGSWTVWRWSQ